MRRQSVPPHTWKSEFWKCSWQENLQFKILQEKRGLGETEVRTARRKTFTDHWVGSQMKTAATLNTNYCIFYIFKIVNKFYCSTTTSFQDCAPSQSHKFWGVEPRYSPYTFPGILSMAAWRQALPRGPHHRGSETEQQQRSKMMPVDAFLCSQRVKPSLFPSALLFQLFMPEILSMRSSAFLHF